MKKNLFLVARTIEAGMSETKIEADEMATGKEIVVETGISKITGNRSLIVQTN